MAPPKAHEWVRGMAPYVPGKATVEGVAHPIKLSANESAYGPSPKAVDAFHAVADTLMRYPDPNSNALRDAIASVHGLDREKIVCGTGSDEILTLLIHMYAGPGDEVVFSKYGFQLYPVQTVANGATGIAVPNKNWQADVDGILAAITEKTKIVFIDNPNNPTGAYLPAAEVARLHAKLPEHVLLVMDEAYAECATAEDFSTSERLVDQYDNVIMTRTFSKMYALAGLRVGWAYGAPAIIDAINRVRMPFNVCLPGIPAAVAAVEDQAHLRAAVAFNEEWREWMIKELRALDLKVPESQTNFVLAAFPEGNRCAEACNDYLASKGYLVRLLSAIPQYIRITIGTEEQNRAVIALIKEFLGK